MVDGRRARRGLCADRLRAVQDAHRHLETMRHPAWRRRPGYPHGPRRAVRPGPGAPARAGTVDAARLYAPGQGAGPAQSADVALRLAAEGVEVIAGPGRLAGPDTVVAAASEIRRESVLIATGARAPAAARRRAGRRADPDLAAAVRPARAAAGTGRGRLRGDRGRVRQRLPGARLAGHPGLLARPGAAARGRGRRGGGGGRVPAPRDDRARPVPGRRGQARPATACWSPWRTAGRCAARTAC